MLYTEFIVGDNTYKLRLNTRNIVALEKQINMGALTIFGDGERVPTVAEMVTILNYSLQQYHHGLNINDAYNIFDEWLAQGNSATDFISVIVDVYKVSGLFKDGGSAEKN